MTTEPDLPLLPAPMTETPPRSVGLWRRWANEPVVPSADVPSSLGSVAFAAAMVMISLLALIGSGEMLMGWARPSVWVILMSPIMAFLFAGIGIQGGLHIYAHVSRRDDGGEIETRFWRWWSDTFGGGILRLVGCLAAVVLAYVALHAMFDGLSKGTALIVALLAGILIMLGHIARRQPK